MRNPQRRKKRDGGPEIVRSCVACKKRYPRWQLLRLVLAPHETTPQVDYLHKLPGRGAYVCPKMACIEDAVNRGGLQRAFSSTIQILPEIIMREAWRASRRYISSLISISKRSGNLLAGHSQVEWGLKNDKGDLLLLASDASDGVKRKFSRWAKNLNIPTVEALSKLELGSSIGSSETSILLITDANLAQKIQRELIRSRELIPILEY